MALRQTHVTAFNSKILEASQNDNNNNINKSSIWSRLRRLRPAFGVKGFVGMCGLILMLVLLWRVQMFSDAQDLDSPHLTTPQIDESITPSTPSTIQTELQHGVINRMKLSTMSQAAAANEQKRKVQSAAEVPETELAKKAAKPHLSIHPQKQQQQIPLLRKGVDPIESISTRATPFAPVSNFRTTFGRPLQAAILSIDPRLADNKVMHSSHFTRCNWMMYCERFDYDLYQFTPQQAQPHPWRDQFLQEYQLPWLKFPLIRDFLRFAILQERFEYDVVVWMDSDISFDQSSSLNEFIISADARDFLTDPTKLFLLWKDETNELNLGFMMIQTQNIPLVLRILDKVLEVPNLPASDTSLPMESHNVSRSLMKQAFPAEAGAFNIAVGLNPKLKKHVMYFTSPFIHGPEGTHFHHVSATSSKAQQWSFFQTEFALQWRARQLLLSHNVKSAKWAKKWMRKQTAKKSVDDHLSAKLGLQPLYQQQSCSQFFHARRCYGNCLTQSCSKCVCGSLSYNQTLGEPLLRVLQQYNLPQSLVSHKELACLIRHRSLGNPRAVSEVPLPTTGTDSTPKSVLITGLMQLSPLDCPSVITSEAQLCEMDLHMECIRHVLLNGKNDLTKAKAILPSSPPSNQQQSTTATRPLYVEATLPWTLPSTCEIENS